MGRWPWRESSASTVPNGRVPGVGRTRRDRAGSVPCPHTKPLGSRNSNATTSTGTVQRISRGLITAGGWFAAARSLQLIAAVAIGLEAAGRGGRQHSQHLGGLRVGERAGETALAQARGT